MRTWKEITEERGFEPQYLRLTLGVGKSTLTVAGMLIEERIDATTIPDGWHVYDIRHDESDWSKPLTVERVVLVNFMGRFLTDRELPLPFDNDECLEVIDYSYEDWADVACDALERAGADSVEIDNLLANWDNLDTVGNNVKRLLSNVLV